MSSSSGWSGSFISRRMRFVTIAVLLIVSLVVLAISLPRIEFQESGPPVSFNIFPNTLFSSPTFESSDSEFSFDIQIEGQTYLLIVWGVMATAALFYAIFTKEGRQNLLSVVVKVAACFFFIQFFGERFWEVIATILNQIFGSGGSEQAVRELLETPQILAVVVSFAIAIPITFFAWRLLSQIRIHDEAPRFSEALNDSLKALDAGVELRDVVLQCYQAMLLEAHRHSGLSRQQAETAGEFRSMLIRQGLPEKEVGRLTALFERARYGSGESNSAERREARQCLTEIIAAYEAREPKLSLNRPTGARA